MILAGESQRTQRKPIPVPLCPPQIPHGLTLAPVVSNASFLKKTGSRTDSVTQNLVKRGGSDSYINAREKGSRTSFWLASFRERTSRTALRFVPPQKYPWFHISYAVKTQT
jgi:hypothetical protein